MVVRWQQAPRAGHREGWPHPRRPARDSTPQHIAPHLLSHIQVCEVGTIAARSPEETDKDQIRPATRERTQQVVLIGTVVRDRSVLLGGGHESELEGLGNWSQVFTFLVV